MRPRINPALRPQGFSLCHGIVTRHHTAKHPVRMYMETWGVRDGGVSPTSLWGKSHVVPIATDEETDRDESHIPSKCQSWDLNPVL